jgi:V8-like Glu-specific endopeptidase
MKRISVFVAVGLLAAGLTPGSAAKPAARRDAAAVVRHRFALSPDEASAFWTPARMRAARPLAVPKVSAHAVGQERSQSRGAPGSVPPVAPTGGHERASEPSSAARAAGPIPYTRQEITTPYTNFPNSANGKIFVAFPSGAVGTCSGTVVNSGPTNPNGVVMTAGGCVYQQALGGFAEALSFVPAFKNSDEPFGEWFPSDAIIPQEWFEDSSNLHFDLAALVVPPADNGDRLQDDTGGWGMAWNQSPSQTVTAYGYPSAPPFTGQLMYSCLSATVSGFHTPPGVGEPTLAIGCDLTDDGTAGGGWITLDEFLNSVFSYKVIGEEEVSFGPYFGDAAEAVYEAAVGGGEPVTHRMKITLKLKGHLTASGRITARDGYAPCGNNAPIRIQRKKAGKWKTVGKTRSKPAGKYSIQIADRPGRYRAFSPAGPVDDQNRCSSAKSGTKRN